MLQRSLARGVQVHQAFFVSFAGNFNGIVLKIAKIDCDQFRQAHTAIQEKDNNAVVPFIKVTLYIF